jgi:hypothetical protein
MHNWKHSRESYPSDVPYEYELEEPQLGEAEGANLYPGA